MWLATCVAFRYTRMVFLSYEGISICLEVREFATLHKFIGFVRGFLPLLLLLLLPVCIVFLALLLLLFASAKAIL